MGRGFEVISPQHALGLVWKRDFDVAAALKSAGTDLGDPAISLIPDNVNIEEGDWVTLNAAQEAIKADGASAVVGALAFAVYTAGSRFDVRASGQVTVLWGNYVARTARIASGLTVVAGTFLAPGTGGDVGKLKVAGSGDLVVAVAERPLEAGTTEFPDGFIVYSTLGCPFVSP